MPRSLGTLIHAINVNDAVGKAAKLVAVHVPHARGDAKASHSKMINS